MVVAALHRLFDDAGLFPPARLPMDQALAAHRRTRHGPWADLVGPFLCPAALLAELDAGVADGLPRPPEIGVVAADDTSWGAVYAAPGLVQVEAPAPIPVPEPPPGVRRYVEIPRHGDAEAVADALDRVAAAGARAKLRCGGPTPEDVPACSWLAAALVGCVERKLEAKATAGLHDPFRSTGPDGPRHGLVNLLAAATAAQGGADTATVSEILATEGRDPADVAALVGVVASDGRELLASVGTCSIDETVEGLTSQGLLSC